MLNTTLDPLDRFKDHKQSPARHQRIQKDIKQMANLDSSSKIIETQTFPSPF